MSDIAICRWLDLKGDRVQALLDLDHVFFSSSARQTFASDQERVQFRERWLGRYLTHFAEHAFVAVTPEGHVAGYVIGSLEDPALDPHFADLPFWESFGDLTARYPAQLHVNVEEARRGQHIGAALITAFARHAEESGAPGVHVVTGRGMRNVGFYLPNGFEELGVHRASGHELLFLGRALSPARF